MAGLKHKIRIVNKTGVARDTEFFTEDGHKIKGIRAFSIPETRSGDIVYVNVEVIAELDIVAEFFSSRTPKPQGEKENA